MKIPIISLPHWIHEEENCLSIDGVNIISLADQYETPFYVYSKSGFARSIEWFKSNFLDSEIEFKLAVKAVPNTKIVRLFSENGFGADVVTRGELILAERSGVPPSQIAFAGVGKTEADLVYALDRNIGYLCVESEWEIEKLTQLKELFKSTKILIRTNLNVDASTHEYLSTGREDNKFGIRDRTVLQKYCEWQSVLPIVGIHVHIGSQILEMSGFVEASKSVISTVQQLRRIGGDITVVDFGGGIGVDYENGETLDINEYAVAVKGMQADLGVKVFLEPGRSLTANNGAIIGRVISNKKGSTKNFVITDVAMNDMIRPALYSAEHRIFPLSIAERKISTEPVDIVGPLCESGDFQGLERTFPLLEEGDFVIVLDAGAYCYAMSSNYNSRPKPAELLVDDAHVEVIRPRQTWDDFI